MSQSLPTWVDLAASHGVQWCSGCEAESNHGGRVTGGLLGLTIHWSDKRPSKIGIRRFLYLIAYAEQVSLGVTPEWRRRYRALRNAIRYLIEAGVRRPAPNWDKERVRLKVMLLKVPTTDPEREEAMDWLQQ